MTSTERDHNDLIQWSFTQARLFLEPLGDRWSHTRGVAERAHQTKQILQKDEQSYLVAAAYLHDIGYAPSLKKTGFHPLDGAYYLQSHNQARLASLVACHSEAQFEAKLRRLEAELERFSCEHSAITDALTYCDMTTNAKGEKVSFEDRIADIFQQYDKESIVFQAIHQAQPFLALAVERTEKRLKEYGSTS